MCIKSMKIADVRSNLGGGETARPHVISLTCHGVLTDYSRGIPSVPRLKTDSKWSGSPSNTRLDYY